MYEYISYEGGLEDYEIPQALLHSCKDAKSKWKDAPVEKRLKKAAEDKALSESKMKPVKIGELQLERDRLLENAKRGALSLKEHIQARKN